MTHGGFDRGPSQSRNANPHSAAATPLPSSSARTQSCRSFRPPTQTRAEWSAALHSCVVAKWREILLTVLLIPSDGPTRPYAVRQD